MPFRRPLDPAETDRTRTPPAAGSFDAAPLGSRLLHKLGELSQSTLASSTAALVSAAFLLGALLAPRATPWLTAFEALAAAVTLVMVFALQHTQARQQAALQRKLDEILRVLPGADNRMVRLENASDPELAALAAEHTQVRQDALTRPGGDEQPGRP